MKFKPMCLATNCGNSFYCQQKWSFFFNTTICFPGVNKLLKVFFEHYFPLKLEIIYIKTMLKVNEYALLLSVSPPLVPLCLVNPYDADSRTRSLCPISARCVTTVSLLQNHWGICWLKLHYRCSEDQKKAIHFQTNLLLVVVKIKLPEYYCLRPLEFFKKICFIV